MDVESPAPSCLSSGDLYWAGDHLGARQRRSAPGPAVLLLCGLVASCATYAALSGNAPQVALFPSAAPLAARTAPQLMPTIRLSRTASAAVAPLVHPEDADVQLQPSHLPAAWTPRGDVAARLYRGGAVAVAMGALLLVAVRRPFNTRKQFDEESISAGAPERQALFTAASVPALYDRPRSWFTEAFGALRAILFLLSNYIVATPLFFLGILPLFPVCQYFDPFVRRALDRVNWLWATLSSFLFFSVEVVNPENLPAEGVAAMYVANHQSWLDIFAMYSLNKSFKWVSKASIFYIPIIGWAMGLSGHVSLKRTDKKSQLQVLKDCMKKLRNGASMFFFPEGTRSKTGQVGPFKKGAFTIAQKLRVPVVPITVIGTGDIMPPGLEGRLYYHKAGIKLIVHPMIRVVWESPNFDGRWRVYPK
eukprot:EG_transcript_12195